MLLRSLTKHVKDQNWFAVALDFFIVVVGILIAFQITNWNDNRSNSANERDFLNRLHGDIVQLQARRAQYDVTRPYLVKQHASVTAFLYGEKEDLSEALELQVALDPNIGTINGFASSLICNSIDWTTSLTVPPAVLPTATELVSAGRVNDIASTDVKAALQVFLQQADRAEVYINAIKKDAVWLSAEHPELFDIKTHDWGYNDQYEATFLKYRCNYEAMRENKAFLNAFALNVNTFSNYANRGVYPVSEKLGLLHAQIDQELGVEHTTDQEAK